MLMMRLSASAIVGLLFLGCQSPRTTTVTETAPAAVATVSELPRVGQSAPGFELMSSDGTAVGLDRLEGRWVVLYFYPKNFTGGCTAEAQGFQRDSARYSSLDAVVLGVSLDSVESHREFCAKEGLSFRLLADVDGSVSARYGSLNERNGRRFSARNTFVIDPEGRIARVFTGVNPTAHSTEVIAALEELRAR